jgi:hypothetical protein
MSAHYGAPGLRRAQLATPSYTASPQGSSIPARSGGAPVVRRKALFVAAATLCAPALAAMALAAIGATGGGGNQAAMGSLAGSQGLRGTTTPSVSSPAPATPHKWDLAARKTDASDSPAAHQVQKHPAPRAPSDTQVNRPAPAPPPLRVKPAPHVTAPTTPAYDPSQPGAPTTSGTTSGTSGSSSTGTSGTSGSGSTSGNHGGFGGTADGYDAYPGGG